MNVNTGEVYDLLVTEQRRKALEAIRAGDEVVGISENEIERLKSLGRKERRAALKGRTRLEQEELKKAIFNQ